MLSRRHLTLIALLSLTPGLGFAQSSNSKKVSWTNNGNNFGNATNWKDASGNATLPSSANVAAFDSAVTAQPTITADQTVDGIEITDSAGNVTLTGNATLTVGASGVANNSSANAQNVQTALVFEGGNSSITNAGTLNVTGPVTNNTNNGLALGGSGNNGNIDGAIGGTGDLIKADAGTWKLNAANSYTGQTIVNGGTLRAGAAGALPNGKDVTVAPHGNSSATLDLNGTTEQIGSLTLGGDAGTNASITLGNGTLAVGGDVVYDPTSAPGTANINGGTLNIGAGHVFNVGKSSGSTNGDVMISAGISGTDLVKQGAGKLVLAGNDTYTGATIVNDGRLQIATGGTHPSGGAVTVDEQTTGGTAVFDLGSTTQTIGALTLRGVGNTANNVDLGPGGTLTLAGNVVYDGSNQPNGATISNGVAVQLGASDRTFDVSQSTGAAMGELTVMTPIAGNAGVIKTNSGTLVLSADNTYTGTTTVNGGTLQIGNGGNSGRVAGDIANNSVVRFNRSDATTFAHVISGTGSLIQNGSGTLTLAAANTFSGPVTVNRGTLAISSDANLGAAPASPTYGQLMLNGGTLEVTGDTALNANRGIGLGGSSATIQTDGTARLTYGGSIDGAGTTLNKTGTGTLELSGSNTYTGPTQVQAGTLKDAAGNAFSPASQVGVAAGAMLSVNNNETIGGLNDLGGAGGSVALGNGANLALNGNGIFSGAISGNGSVELASTSYTNETLTGTNTYTGGTKIGSGTTLQIGVGATGVGGTSGSITSGNITNNGSLILMRSDAIHYGGISGTGQVRQSGAGTVTLDTGNTYTGGTYIDSGTVTDSAAGALPNGGDVFMSGGALNIAHNETIGGLGDSGGAGSPAAVAIGTGATLTLSNRGSAFSGSITGGGALQLTNGAYETITGSAGHSGGTMIGNGSTLQIGNGATSGAVTGTITNNGSLAFNRSDAISYGGITGSGSVTQLGSGTLTLSGANTYTGQTVINAGTVGDANAGAFSTASTIRLYNTATLNVNAAESIGGLGGSYYGGNTVVNLNGALTISGHGDSYAGAILGNGSLTIATGAHQTLAGSMAHTGGTAIASGASLQIGNGYSNASVAGDITDNGSLTFSPAATVAYAGKISGAGSLNVNNTSGTVSLSGQSTYSGSTNIGSGTLQVATNNALPTTTNLWIGNGRLDVASDQTIGQVNGSNSSAVSLSGHTLTIAPQAAGKNSSLDGAITGTGTLVFNGAPGTSLALNNGGSSYTGGTQIASGAVYVASNGALGTGQVSVQNGAALLLGNSDSSDVNVSNAVVLASGATVGGGGNDYVLGLTGSVAVPTTAATVHLQDAVKFSGNLHAASGTSAVTFDSADGHFARGLLLGTVDPSITSINTSNAGVIFGSQSAVPAAGLSVAASTGYIGVGAASGYTPPSAASVLNLIGNKGSFGGTIGFDSTDHSGAPHTFSDNVDLSTFGAGTALGSSTAAVLSGTITPGANGYLFGNGGGVLVVQSALAGSDVAVSSTTSVPGNSLTAVFQGANSFNGHMSVGNSVAVLDSATALPVGRTVTLGDNGYIGYTEAFTGATSFGDFVAHELAPGGYTSTSILGIDSHSYIANALASGNPSGARTVSDTIDLSGLNSVYLGTATGLTLGGSIKAPNQNGANKVLSLLAADDATLTISSALTSDNVSSVIVGSGAAFANGTVFLQGLNTYAGGTTLRSGTLQLQQSSYTSHGSIVAGPLGTGTLTINPAGSKQPVVTANGYVVLDNSVALAGSVQLGTPNSSYYTESSTTVSGTAALSGLSYGELILNGVISDVGGAHGSLVIAGPTQLNAANTFTGGTTIQADQLEVGNDAALGTGSVTISSVTNRLDLYSYNGARTLSNAVAISGSQQSVYFGGNFTLNGSLALNAPLSVSVDGPDTLRLNGPLTGTSSFTANYGTVLLTPSAPTTANGGFMASNGAIIFGNPNALPAQPAYNAFSADYDGYIGIGFVPADLQNGFINRFNKGATNGAIGFDSGSLASPNTFNTPVDLTGFQNSARLGSATVAILGAGATITPQGSTYNFGSGGGLLRVDSALTDAPANAVYPGSRDVNVDSNYDGPLTLRLTGANTYSGGTAVYNSGVIFGTGALPAQGAITGDDGYVGTEDPALIANPNNFVTRFDPDVYSMIVGFDSGNGGSVTVANDISLAGFTDSVFLGTSTNALIAGNITLPSGQTSYNFAGYKGGQLTVATALTGANSVTVGQDYNQATFANPAVANSPLSRVTLTGANSYTGGTYLNAGELFVGNEHALGSGTLTISGDTANDGRHEGFSTTTNAITLPNSIALTWAQLDVGAGDATFGLSGSISGQSSSALYKVGSGTLTLSGDNSGFGGNVVIRDGSVIFAASTTGNSFGTGGLTFDSPSAVAATFQDNAVVNGLQDYHGTGTVTLTAGKTFTINQTTDSDFGGTIAGSTSGLTLTGGGYHLVLSGTNTYVGPTTVQGSVAVVAANSSAFGAATNAVTLNGGKIVLEPGVTISNPLTVTAGKLAGVGTFGASNVTIGTNTLLAPGTSEAIGTLRFANSLTFANGGTLQLRLADVGATSGGWDQVQVGGTLAITATTTPFTLQVVPFTAGGLLTSTLPANFNPYTAGSWMVLSANSITGFNANQFTIDSSAFSGALAGGSFSLAMNATNTGLMLNFTPVPEPSTYALMLAGVGAVLFVSRRRRRR